MFPFLQAHLLRVALPKRICARALVLDHRTPVSVRLCFAWFICLFQFSSPEQNPFPSLARGAGGSFSELYPWELVRRNRFRFIYIKCVCVHMVLDCSHPRKSGRLHPFWFCAQSIGHRYTSLCSRALFCLPQMKC